MKIAFAIQWFHFLASYSNRLKKKTSWYSCCSDKQPIWTDSSRSLGKIHPLPGQSTRDGTEPDAEGNMCTAGCGGTEFVKKKQQCPRAKMRAT